MKTLAKLAVATAFSATLVGSALAEGHSVTPPNEFYAAIFGGVVFSGDSDTSGIITPPGGEQTVDTDFDNSFIIGGTIGMFLNDLGNEQFTPRIEAELSYTDRDADEIFFSGNGAAAEVNVDGGISVTLLMANAIADFKTDSAFTPYLGVGVGAGFVDYDLSYGAAVRASDSDTGFAAQAIAGVAVEVTETVDWTFDARYSKVFDVDSARFNGATNTGTISGDIDNVSITTGLRFKF